MINKLKRENRFALLKAALLFFSVYSIHLTSMMVTPRIIVLSIVLVLYLLRGKISINRKQYIFILESLFFCIYAILLVYGFKIPSSDAETIPTYTVNYLIFVCIFPILSEPLFSDEIDFCSSLFIANSIQSIIVIASAFIPSVRKYLELIQEIDFSRYNYRIVGLGLAGAGGSVYLFCGFFAATYLLLYNKRSNFVFIGLYLINFIAIILVGRTGFYCAVVVLLFTIGKLIQQKNTQSLKFLVGTVFAGFAIVIALFAISSRYDSNTQVLQYTFTRLNDIFKSDSALTSIQKMNQNFPNLGSRFLTGTGVVRGYTNDGIKIWHDGGYAQRLAAFGLIVMLFSYLSYYKYLRNYILRKKGSAIYSFYILTSLLLVIIEYKEPFMYMMAYPYCLLMMSILSDNSPLLEEERIT